MCLASSFRTLLERGLKPLLLRLWRHRWGAVGLPNAPQMGKVRAKVGHRSRLSVLVMEIIGNRAETVRNRAEIVRKGDVSALTLVPFGGFGHLLSLSQPTLDQNYTESDTLLI